MLAERTRPSPTPSFTISSSLHRRKSLSALIELNPNYATAHQWYARTNLLMTGQFDRAIAEMKRAVELDPVSPMFHAELGGVYMVARRYDEAIEQIAEHHRNGSGNFIGLTGFWIGRWN